MKLGNDQTVARDLNLELIFKMLKSDYLSSSDLAKKLQLSKAALTKIMNEMIDLNLVMISHKGQDSDDSLGRKKTYFKINPQAGMIGVINFAAFEIDIIIATIDGTIIAEESIEAEFITIEDLEKVASILNRLKEKYETPSFKLLSVCVAAPGQINKFTQEFHKSPKFMKCENIKIKDILTEKVNVEMILKNDINLLIIGEKEHGNISNEINNALLIHIDAGIGGAILNNNEVLEGENGFAGEFGLIKTYDRLGNCVPYDAICSTNSIKNQIKYLKIMQEDTGLKDDFKLNDVVVAFNSNNLTVRKIVLESAKYISIMVSDLYNIFDFKHIYISGRIKLFGPDYISEIERNLVSLKGKISLSYSKLNDEAVNYGALNVASEVALKKLLVIRKKNGNGYELKTNI